MDFDKAVSNISSKCVYINFRSFTNRLLSHLPGHLQHNMLIDVHAQANKSLKSDEILTLMDCLFKFLNHFKILEEIAAHSQSISTFTHKYTHTPHISEDWENSFMISTTNEKWPKTHSSLRFGINFRKPLTESSTNRDYSNTSWSEKTTVIAIWSDSWTWNSFRNSQQPKKPSNRAALPSSPRSTLFQEVSTFRV